MHGTEWWTAHRTSLGTQLSRQALKSVGWQQIRTYLSQQCLRIPSSEPLHSLLAHFYQRSHPVPSCFPLFLILPDVASRFVLVMPPCESSSGWLWDLPEVGPDSRYRMEEQLYPECHPAIGWPDFREVYMQVLQEDEELHDYTGSFYRMREEQWLLEEAFRSRRDPWLLTPELSPLTADRGEVLFNSLQLDWSVLLLILLGIERKLKDKKKVLKMMINKSLKN